MKRFALAAFAVSAVCAANAMHIQIGASGWSRHAGQWIDGSVGIGATAGTLSSQICAAYGWTDYGSYYYYVPLGAKRITTGNESWTESCYVRFIPGGGLSLYAATTSPDYTEQYGAKRFVAAETVSLGTFGYTSQYHNYAWDHAVITIRGDPYSTVLNDTDTDRTVNGVLIPAGEARALPFPIYLVMDEIENVKTEEGSDLAQAQALLRQYQYLQYNLLYDEGGYMPELFMVPSALEDAS